MNVSLSMGFSKTMTKVKSNLEGLRIGKTTTTIKDVAKTPPSKRSVTTYAVEGAPSLLS